MVGEPAGCGGSGGVGNNSILGGLLLLVALLVTAAAFIAVNTNYRRALFTLRRETESAQSKYELIRDTLDDTRREMMRLRTTVVQRDAEIAELKKK